MSEKFWKKYVADMAMELEPVHAYAVEERRALTSADKMRAEALTVLFADQLDRIE